MKNWDEFLAGMIANKRVDDEIEPNHENAELMLCLGFSSLDHLCAGNQYLVKPLTVDSVHVFDKDTRDYLKTARADRFCKPDGDVGAAYERYLEAVCDDDDDIQRSLDRYKRTGELG